MNKSWLLFIAAMALLFTAAGCTTHYAHNRRHFGPLDGRPLKNPVMGMLRGAGISGENPFQEQVLLANDADLIQIPDNLAGEWLQEPNPNQTVAGRWQDIIDKGEEKKRESFKSANPGGIHRRMIYNAFFTVQVYDIEAAQKKLMDLAVSYKGYVQEQRDTALILRVPSAKFKEINAVIEKIGRVHQRKIKTDDVTEQYFDLELRLRTKKEYLEGLEKLLEAASSLKEKLDVKREIGRIIEEIERLEGKLRYLAHEVLYSTIHVSFALAYEGSAKAFQLSREYRWFLRLGIESLMGE